MNFIAILGIVKDITFNRMNLTN